MSRVTKKKITVAQFNENSVPEFSLNRVSYIQEGKEHDVHIEVEDRWGEYITIPEDIFYRLCEDLKQKVIDEQS